MDPKSVHIWCIVHAVWCQINEGTRTRQAKTIHAFPTSVRPTIWVMSGVRFHVGAHGSKTDAATCVGLRSVGAAMLVPPRTGR